MAGLAVSMSTPAVWANRTLEASTPQPASELMAFTSPAGEGRQMLVIVSPQQQVVSVYHVDVASGEIALRSVRNIQGDLAMDDFNGVRPTPGEIRQKLERPHAPVEPLTQRPFGAGELPR
jgi:hypothetical protein